MIHKIHSYPIIISILLSGCSFILPTLQPVISQTAQLTMDLRVTNTPTETYELITDTPEFTILPDTPTPPVTIIMDTPSPSLTPTPTPTQVPLPKYRFMMQPGSPKPVENIFHPESGCNWMGISGQIFNLEKLPLSEQLVLQIKGVLNGEDIELLAIVPDQNFFLPGGFDFRLADIPIESSGTIYLMLFDLDGNQISDKVFITTYADCMKNSIIVNFVEIPPIESLTFMPLVVKH